MRKLYTVQLTDDQRSQLTALLSAGTCLARVQTHARVLLLADQGARDPEIVAALGVSRLTVERTRKTFATANLEAALYDRPRSGRPVRITGDSEAALVMLACSTPPAGRAHWTLQLLADKLIELHYTETISDQQVYKLLKKNELKPWLKKQWCLPGPAPNARFVAKMEEVLAVYCRPYDPARPVVCVDEKSKELHSDPPGRAPLPPQPGLVARQDYEYVRHGTANIFVALEPLVGQRRIWVTERRTGQDLGELLGWLVDEVYPGVEKIVLITDNLNTHGPWALYETFAPEEAARLAAKLEWHYTPEHGSWLNMAEIELSALEQQYLDQRFAHKEQLSATLASGEQERNTKQVQINWQFTTADARIKLRRLYPSIKT